LIDTTLGSSMNTTDLNESEHVVDEKEQSSVHFRERIIHLEEENALLLEQKNRAMSLLKKK
jgi:hypothetical protein